MKEDLRKIIKSELGFAPDADEVNIKSDTKAAVVAEINGHYYDYYKANKHLSFRDRMISDAIEKVVETFVWNRNEKKEVEQIIRYDEELQNFIRKHQFRDEVYDPYDFRSEFSFILDKKIEDNKDLKKQVKEAAEKDVNKNYDICIFAGIQIKSKNYYGICFADILKKRDIEFKTNDLDLGIIYPWASSNCEREYICKDGKAKYVYEFIVSAGDDYQSTVYFCNKRLSKEFLTEFDYLNSINAIEWF